MIVDDLNGVRAQLELSRRQAEELASERERSRELISALQEQQSHHRKTEYELLQRVTELQAGRVILDDAERELFDGEQRHVNRLIRASANGRLDAEVISYLSIQLNTFSLCVSL
jgi:oligoribonuclease NrnB/cAMP/cGMP phosphodiesterase (DHH superfamily)